MGTELRSRRAVGLFAGLLCLANAVAQHEPHPAAVPPKQLPSAAEQKRGAKTPPTHAPNPSLPPLLALHHVQTGNAAAAKAIAAGADPGKPATRPAGAGRYVCAVLLCCDLDVDIHKLLGLRREDVFVVSAPGPFATPETMAALERTLLGEPVPMLLVLGHADCRLLQNAPPNPVPNGLTRRADAAREQAARMQQPLPKTIVQMQRELLLASSEPLRQAVVADTLRVFPGELDARTGAVTWHHQRADAMPIAPVK